ncbi:MAG: PQQ-binding-like beta-propeller repeat protein [Planctomycetota bacterium]
MIPTTLALLLTALSSSDDWPAWRGAQGNGLASSASAPLTWDTEKNVKWRVPLGLPANGSPVVAGGRVFLTSPQDEEGKARSLYCFDAADGKELWVRTVEFGQVMPTHRTNPYGGSTPAADGERVVVWHSSAGLYCYDYEGGELWKRDLGEFRHQWGYGTSPLLHEGKVILHTGPGETSFVAAFDLDTGDTVWRTDEPEHRDAKAFEEKRLAGSWCTPRIVPGGDGEERDLVLCGQPTRVVAYDAADGSIVWTCSGVSGTRGDLTYSSPVLAGDVCLVVGGWEGPTLGVRMGGEGDVTESHRLWRHAGQMSNCGSGVYFGDRVVIPDMGGMLWSIDPKTGEADWRKRIGRGNTWGSVVQAGGRLYLMNQKGTTVVFTSSPEGIEVLSENHLGEDTNSTPAIAGGEIFLRTHEHLYCIAEEG